MFTNHGPHVHAGREGRSASAAASNTAGSADPRTQSASNRQHCSSTEKLSLSELVVVVLVTCTCLPIVIELDRRRITLTDSIWILFNILIFGVICRKQNPVLIASLLVFTQNLALLMVLRDTPEVISSLLKQSTIHLAAAFAVLGLGHYYDDWRSQDRSAAGAEP